MDNIIQCSNGHLFCKICIQRYIEETMFGSGSVCITCISTEKYYDNYTTTTNSNSNSGGAESEVCNGQMCNGRFSDEMVKMCLSEMVYDKYQGMHTYSMYSIRVYTIRVVLYMGIFVYNKLFIRNM